jgi:hypothetical protein
VSGAGPGPVAISVTVGAPRGAATLWASSVRPSASGALGRPRACVCHLGRRVERGGLWDLLGPPPGPTNGRGTVTDPKVEP